MFEHRSSLENGVLTVVMVGRLDAGAAEEVMRDLELTGEMEGLEEQIEQLDSEPHAVSEEDFEAAAGLRDLIRELQAGLGELQS